MAGLSLRPRLGIIRQERARWAHPKAVWAADFMGGRIGPGGAVATVRSSPHLLTDAQGIVRSFPANTLASTIGVGAYIGGQTVNLLLASCAFTTPLLWTKYGSPAIADNAALAPDGAMTAASFSGAAGGAYLLTQNINVTAEQKYTLAVWMRGAAGGEKVRIDFKNQTSGGISGTLFTLTSGWKRYSVTLTADATAQRGFQFRVEAAMGNPDFTFFMWNAVVEAGSFASPDIVSPVDAQGVRLASDVRAVSMDWFSAAGLDAGYTILAEVDLTHTGDGVTRRIAYQSASGDYTVSRRLSILADDTVQMQTLNSSAGQDVKLTAPGAVTAGRLKVAARFQPGAHRLAVSGRAAQTNSSARALDAMTGLMIGASDVGPSQFLNDTIRSMQVCKPLTDAEMDAWVAS